MNQYKKDFPMSLKYVMLDNAAIAFKPKVMVDTIVDFYLNKANNPHSKDSPLAKYTLEKIEETRELIAKLTNSKPNEVIFTSGTSHAANLIISAITATFTNKDEAIIFMDSHASGVIPLLAARKHKRIKIHFVKDKNDVEKVLNLNTKVLFVPQMNNTTGDSHDVKSIYKITKKIAPNCLVINDIAQAIVHDVVDFQYADALIFSGMKLYGPTGSGALILKEELIEKLEPQEYGGGANKKFTLDKWVPSKGYLKWEVGTQNIAGIIGLGASIKYVCNIGLQNMFDMEEKVATYLYNQLKLINNIHIFSKLGSHTVLFYIKRTDAHEIAAELAKKNILVRAGYHCAGIMGNVLNYQGATLRTSIALYNDKDDVDKFIVGLKEVLATI